MLNNNIRSCLSYSLINFSSEKTFVVSVLIKKSIVELKIFLRYICDGLLGLLVDHVPLHDVLTLPQTLERVGTRSKALVERAGMRPTALERVATRAKALETDSNVVDVLLSKLNEIMDSNILLSLDLHALRASLQVKID